MLIIGAGSGNDVQAALANGVRHVDAVEIDPVIYEIGRNDHPEPALRRSPRDRPPRRRPRASSARRTQTYDLVIYALVDSLVLHSGYSSLRLESFLFTEQAFRDIKAKLKPGGVFAMYNYFRQGWVVGRLADDWPRRSSARSRSSLSSPTGARSMPGARPGGAVTFLLVGEPGPRPLAGDPRRSSRTKGSSGSTAGPLDNGPINGFATSLPPSDGSGRRWMRIGPARSTRPASAHCRPTTGRSSIFASRGSPTSTSAAWR